MSFEVDQSGKVEDTSRPTAIAGSNDTQYSIYVSAKEKRKLQEMFRFSGVPIIFVDCVFSILIATLAKETERPKITVDLEYSGHEKIINNMVSQLTNVEIHWSRLGKLSPAHELAYKIYKRRLTPNKKLSSTEIWRQAKKITGGYLKAGLSPANRYSAPVYKEHYKQKYGKKSR